MKSLQSALEVFDLATAIACAAASIRLGNNGYADVGSNESVARGLEAEGFTVLATTDLHGRTVFRGFTPAAQAALAVSPFGASTYKAVTVPLELPDLEALLLARAARDPDTDEPARLRALGLI